MEEVVQRFFLDIWEGEKITGLEAINFQTTELDTFLNKLVILFVQINDFLDC